MKARLLRFAAVAAVAASLPSCGAANSVYQTANRVLQAVNRTISQ